MNDDQSVLEERGALGPVSEASRFALDQTQVGRAASPSSRPSERSGAATPRKPRRRRVPPARRRPGQSEAMRRRWRDPEYRAKQRVHFERRKADPTKAWSRLGIADGHNRESAAKAWQAAEERAKVAMAALKRQGLI